MPHNIGRGEQANDCVMLGHQLSQITSGISSWISEAMLYVSAKNSMCSRLKEVTFSQQNISLYFFSEGKTPH